MKKLSISVLSAAIVASLLAACSGGNSAVIPTSAGAPVTTPSQTAPPSQPAPQARATATFTITVPKAVSASSASRRVMYVSPNTASLRVAVTQVDGVSPSIPDFVVALNAQTQGCATNATSGALTCTLNVVAVAGNNVTFQISTYASTNGTGQLLSQGTVTAKIVSNASNPIAISLGGVVSKIVFSPSAIPVYADGSGHRYFITVNAEDATGATIVGSERYQSPISLTVKNDPAGALTLSEATLPGPGSSFYLTYDSSKYVDGASVSASDGTNADGSLVQTQLSVDPLSYGEPTPNGSYGIVQGTTYSLTLHEKNFAGSYSYTLSDPAVESVAISTPDSNGNATVTITPSATNSGYSLLTVSDGTVTMPIGTQVLPNSGPTITITNLPYSGTHHNAPYRLLAGAPGSTDLWFSGSGDGVLGKFNITTKTVSNYYAIPWQSVPEYMQWANGKIWYADGDPSVPSIDSFDPTTSTFNQYTAGLAMPSFPFDIITGPDGKLWYGDQGPGAQGIGTFDAANPTAGVKEYTGGMEDNSRPISLAIGPDNNIWFADQAYGTGSEVTGAVGYVDMTTHAVTEYRSGLPPGATDEEDGPAGIVSDGQKLWFVGWGGYGYVGSIDPATKQIQLYTAGFQEGAIPTHPVISPDHTTLWFFTYGADPLRGLLYGVAKFDIPSKRVTEYRTGFKAGAAHEPSDMVYGPDGNIWFADSVYSLPSIGEIH